MSVNEDRHEVAGDLGWVAALLAECRDDVLDRWVKAAARQPFHHGRLELAVSNHFGRLYDAVVVLLRGAPATADHVSAWVDPAALLAAEDHAEDRFSQGLEPCDIVVEFRLLREETGRAVLMQVPDGVPVADAIRATMLMNSVFDGALMVILRTLSRHLDETRADVLATATHDLAQPLTTIKAAVQLAHLALGRPQPDLKVVDVAHGRALAGAEHVVHLLSRLAEGARLATGDLDLRPTDDTDLADVVRRALSRLEAADEARVAVDVPATPGEATGRWDALGLDRVVDNLLSNALKYSPPSAPIEVTVRRLDDTVELAVRDAGIGLEKDEIARLFRRYQRARGAIESAVTGTGLGLYFARAMVEAHHGRIWATSGGRGKGTTVHVLLPRAAPVSATVQSRDAAEALSMTPG